MRVMTLSMLSERGADLKMSDSTPIYIANDKPKTVGTFNPECNKHSGVNEPCYFGFVYSFNEITVVSGAMISKSSHLFL